MAKRAKSAVLDASVVVDLLVRGEPRLPDGFAFVAPAHLDAEVLSALARLARGGSLSAGAVEDMLVGLAELAAERLPLAPLVSAAFELRGNVSQRDSLYVALAQSLGCPLITRDERLAAACRSSNLCAALTWDGAWT